MTGVNIKVNADTTQARSEMAKLGASVKGIEKSTSGMQKLFNGLAIGLGAMASVSVFTKSISRASDSIIKLENSLKVVMPAGQNVTGMLNRLREVSVETRSPIANVTLTFNRLAMAMGNKASTANMVQVVENIQKAAAISGATVIDAERAIRQLGQGLTGGVLRAEEYNSIIDGMPRLAKAIADGMKIPLDNLRQAMLDGLLTRDVIFDALLESTTALNDEFALTEVTITQLTALMGDQFARALKKIGEITGVTKFIKEDLLGLTTVFKFVADKADYYFNLAKLRILIFMSQTERFFLEFKETVKSVFTDAFTPVKEFITPISDKVTELYNSTKGLLSEISALTMPNLTGDFKLPTFDFSTFMPEGTLASVTARIKSWLGISENGEATSGIAGLFYSLYKYLFLGSPWKDIWGKEGINSDEWGGGRDEALGTIGLWIGKIKSVFSGLWQSVRSSWSKLTQTFALDLKLPSDFAGSTNGETYRTPMGQFFDNLAGDWAAGQTFLDEQLTSWGNKFNEKFGFIFTGLSNTMDKIKNLFALEIELPEEMKAKSGKDRVRTKLGQRLDKVKEDWESFKVALMTTTVAVGPGGMDTDIVDSPLALYVKAIEQYLINADNRINSLKTSILDFVVYNPDPNNPPDDGFRPQQKVLTPFAAGFVEEFNRASAAMSRFKEILDSIFMVETVGSGGDVTGKRVASLTEFMNRMRLFSFSDMFEITPEAEALLENLKVLGSEKQLRITVLFGDMTKAGQEFGKQVFDTLAGFDVKQLQGAGFLATVFAASFGLKNAITFPIKLALLPAGLNSTAVTNTIEDTAEGVGSIIRELLPFGDGEADTSYVENFIAGLNKTMTAAARGMRKGLFGEEMVPIDPDLGIGDPRPMVKKFLSDNTLIQAAMDTGINFATNLGIGLLGAAGIGLIFPKLAKSLKDSLLEVMNPFDDGNQVSSAIDKSMNRQTGDDSETSKNAKKRGEKLGTRMAKGAAKGFAAYMALNFASEAFKTMANKDGEITTQRLVSPINPKNTLLEPQTLSTDDIDGAADAFQNLVVAITTASIVSGSMSGPFAPFVVPLAAAATLLYEMWTSPQVFADIAALGLYIGQELSTALGSSVTFFIDQLATGVLGVKAFLGEMKDGLSEQFNTTVKFDGLTAAIMELVGVTPEWKLAAEKIEADRKAQEAEVINNTPGGDEPMFIKYYGKLPVSAKEESQQKQNEKLAKIVNDAVALKEFQRLTLINEIAKEERILAMVSAGDVRAQALNLMNEQLLAIAGSLPTKEERNATNSVFTNTLIGISNGINGTADAITSFFEGLTEKKKEIKQRVEQVTLDGGDGRFMPTREQLSARREAAEDRNMATGGLVQGPGTETSDDIPAMLSRNEFVMNAKAVRKFGPNYLARMNQGLNPIGLKHGGSHDDIDYQNSVTSRRTSEEILIMSEAALRHLSAAELIFHGNAKLAAATKNISKTKLSISKEAIREIDFQLSQGDTVSAARLFDTLTQLERATYVLGLNAEETAKLVRGQKSAADLELEERKEIFAQQAAQVRQNFADSLKNAFRTGDFSTILDSVVDNFTGQIMDNAIDSLVGGFFDTSGIEEGMAKLFMDDADHHLELGGSIGTKLKDGMSEGAENVAAKPTETLFGGVMGTFQTMTGGLIDSISSIFNSTLGGGGLGGGLGNLLGGAGGGVGSWLSGLAGGGGMGGGLASLGMKFLGFSQGGIVPSTSSSIAGKDSVPAMLTPGELVVPKGKLGERDTGRGGNTQNINLSITGDISRQTKGEIYKMLPQIASGVNGINKENGFSR
jgi:tape measure domain-containing protein